MIRSLIKDGGVGSRRDGPMRGLCQSTIPARLARRARVSGVTVSRRRTKSLKPLDKMVMKLAI